MHFNIDRPAALALCDPLAIRIEGWLFAGQRHAALIAVEMLAEGQVLGESRFFFPRPDVAAAHRFPPSLGTGFSLLGFFDNRSGADSLSLEFRACFADGTTETFARQAVRLIRMDHRRNHYGGLLVPGETKLRHRAQIYSSGPSVDGGSPECLDLIRRYVGPPPRRVLDIGCGLGFYGKHLRSDGHDWLGAEVKESDCAELARRGLPHQLVDGRKLPFAENCFDTAICIEVLEHIEEPDGFLAEVRRMAPRLLISVPNIEIIPCLQPHLVVPWHLLEADHKNFFTRWSLRALLAHHYQRVEVVSYGEAPLRTAEGTRLDYHLFAIASV
ncbi:MAG TPA: class I SAM-dependent methyltransferase [Opitutaceae bacterium]|nr:class I SAM-dependent methyltransferase [Opitutaceae bacterium]